MKVTHGFVIHLWIVQSTGKGVSIAYFSVTKIGVWAIIEYWLQGGYEITMSDLDDLGSQRHGVISK